MKKLIMTAALALGACTTAGPPPQTASACSAPLKPAVEVDLYFGRETAAGGKVSDAQWAKFLADEVTPRFPDGLSVIDVAGQSREPSGAVGRESTKLLVVVTFDAPGHLAKVRSIVDAYNARFGQRSVFHTEHAVCAGLG